MPLRLMLLPFSPLSPWRNPSWADTTLGRMFMSPTLSCWMLCLLPR